MPVPSVAVPPSIRPAIMFMGGSEKTSPTSTEAGWWNTSRVGPACRTRPSAITTVVPWSISASSGSVVA